MNREVPDVQAEFKKDRGPRDQIANMGWIIEKARELWKNIYFNFIDFAKGIDCVDHKKMWKILKEMGIPDHLTCLLSNLYACQEATVRTGHGKQIGSKLGKQHVKVVYCHSSYLTYMQSTSCEMLGWMNHKLESRLLGQHLRYVAETILIVEHEEELKSLLMSVREKTEKAGLKHNIQKTKIMAFRPITSWQIDGENGNSDRIYFLGLQIHCRW